MDETIGVKGGHNDRRRVVLIKKRKKKKKELDNDVKSLEKKVKKKQVYTLVRTLPIVIGGGVIQTIYDVSTGRKKIDKEREYSKFIVNDNNDVNPLKGTIDEDRVNLGKKKTIILDGKKIEIRENIVFDKNNKTKEKDKYQNNLKDEVHISSDDKFIFDNKKIDNNSSNNKDSLPKSNINDDIKYNKILDIANYSYGINRGFKEREDFSDLSFDNKEKLQKLKSRRIIDEYEKQLKDVRYELRQLIYEYNVLCQNDEEAVLSFEVDIIIDKLSEIIDKIEELKAKIRIDNLDKYDDQYIYYLIENYMEEFRNDRVIKSIKDSSLYILISNKLDEIDNKKDKFNKKLDEKREELKNKEENFEKLKKKYYSIEKFNEDLIAFQEEQELLLEKVRDKVNNAVSETEKITVELEAMNLQNSRLMRRLAFQMFLPGPKFINRMSLNISAYLFFLRNIINPKTVTKKYKVITVEDYSGMINDAISEIDYASDLIYKNQQQVDKVIDEVKTKYKDYIGVVSECDNIINGLYAIKRNLDEKQYEIDKIKDEQRLQLEANNAKVLTRGEYSVN